MEEEKKQETNVIEKVTEEVDKSITRIMQQGVQTNNVDFLYKMIDIKKDIAEIEKEEQEMMYGNYGNYGRDSYGEYSEGSYSGGRRRDSRGRYMEGGSYGRRGVPGTGRGRYRGEEALEDMQYHYGNYSEGASYGHDQESEKSFDKMIECLEDFAYTIMEEADEPQKIEKIKRVAKRISDM